MIVHFIRPRLGLAATSGKVKGQQVEGFQGSPITRDTYGYYGRLWKFTLMLRSGVFWWGVEIKSGW